MSFQLRLKYSYEKEKQHIPAAGESSKKTSPFHTEYYYSES